MNVPSRIVSYGLHHTLIMLLALKRVFSPRVLRVYVSYVVARPVSTVVIVRLQSNDKIMRKAVQYNYGGENA